MRFRGEEIPVPSVELPLGLLCRSLGGKTLLLRPSAFFSVSGVSLGRGWGVEENPSWGDFVKGWEEPCDGGSVCYSA